MKKLLNKMSLLAFVMVCVLALSNVGATNCAASSSGKGMDITDTLGVNDGYTKDGSTIKVNADKGEWSFFYFDITGNAKERVNIQIVLEGPAGLSYLKKLEQGGVEVIEEAGTFKGGEETIVWTVDANNLPDGTDPNPAKLIMFINPGTAGGNGEEIKIKSVKLLTADELAAADDDANDDQGTADEDQEAADDSQNSVPKTGDASVVTWVALFVVGSTLVVAAKKRQII